MQPVLFGVFDFFARNKWAQYALIVLSLGLALVFWGNSREARGVKRERARQEKRAAEERARIIETARTIERETHDDAARAREAGDALPQYPDAERLRNERPDLAAIVFGDRERDGG